MSPTEPNGPSIAWLPIPTDTTDAVCRENRNLQMVRRFTDMEHRLITSENVAWREAVAAKEAEVAMMRKRRCQREDRQE